MPKIKNIPYSPQESFGIDQNYGRKQNNNTTYLPMKSEAFKNVEESYSRYRNNPNQQQQQISNYKSFYDKQKVVPIHEVKYNPQFCKSPLASHVMNMQDIDNNNFQRVKYEDQQDYNKKSKCNPVLLAILGILALVALLIGIYFIFKSISNSNNQSKVPSYNLNDLQDGKQSIAGGIKPIQIQPIPFYQKPTSNTYYQTEPSNSFNSWPSTSNEVFQRNTMLNALQLSNQNKGVQSEVFNPNLNTNQVIQNSISPINVYASKAT